MTPSNSDIDSTFWSLVGPLEEESFGDFSLDVDLAEIIRAGLFLIGAFALYLLVGYGLVRLLEWLA